MAGDDLARDYVFDHKEDWQTDWFTERLPLGGPVRECQQSFVTYNGVPLPLVGDK